MTKEQLQRYSRHLFQPAIGVEGQREILASRVLVIGAGGLGAPVLQYLAAAGVGTLGIIDFDHVEIHNLHRQIIHTETTVGQAKADSALAFLQRLNSSVTYIAYPEKLSAANIEQIFSGFDFIVDGTDNFATRYLVNDTCVAMDKTLVYGSILNFEAQIAVFNHQKGKNLRHLYPDPPPPEAVPDCSLNGVMGTLPGIAGTIMAQETLKAIIGLPTLRNQLLLLNTLNWQVSRLDI